MPDETVHDGDGMDGCAFVPMEPEERVQHMRDVLFPLYRDWRADELDHG